MLREIRWILNTKELKGNMAKITPSRRIFVALTIFLITTAATFSSVLDGFITNGDFESGNLDGWKTSGQTSVSAAGLDPITNNALERVAEGQYSAMIGDEIPWMGESAEQQSSLEQVIQLPSSLPSDSVLEFVYAVVANDPPDHPESDKPRFRVSVSDLTSDKLLLDTEYLYTSQTSKDWYLGTGASNQIWNQPYYMLAGDRWVFRPWKIVTVPLMGLGGHQLLIRFEIRDCNYGAHAIYGLLDYVRVGGPSNINLPSLQGDPQKAVYIAPPFWAPVLRTLEQWGAIWLCCLLPLLLLGILLSYLFKRKPQQQLEPVYDFIQSEKRPEATITGGIRKKLDDE